MNFADGPERPSAAQSTDHRPEGEPMKTHLLHTTALVMALSLTACGGGGGSTDPGVVNVAPVASAGPLQNVSTGATVTLDGHASSDANGDALSYLWTVSSKPGGSAATLASATSAAPSFVADLAGDYLLSLTVNDGKVDSAATTVKVTATVPNAAPVANAGTALFLATGGTAKLDASASSDANGDALTYAWTLSTKPAGSAAVLSSASAAKPSFVADLTGAYVATLTVNDGKLNSTAATVAVNAVAPKPVNVAYVATNNMTVKLNSFTATTLSDGSVQYIAGYTQENHGTVAIDQIAPRLFFANAEPLGTSALPGQVLPGHTTVTFSLYNAAGSAIPLLLQYDASPMSALPVPGALQWTLPLP
jgi:hypothetical protein